LCITWLEADALDLPFGDQTFDAMTMGYGLRNVTDIPRCLQEAYRVLKPGCKAAILDFHQPQNSWIQAFQQWYLQTIVVPAAAQLGLTEEYAYLGPSLERFPSGPEQVKLGYQAGFTSAVHYPIAGDMMGVLVLAKAFD
jgi:demethylmenaquinone methyltransferase/2-methoxy-6-polyprenyl-1,4-benzoquinol methylase